MTRAPLAIGIGATSLSLALFAGACTEGVTPDCTGANAVACAPPVDAGAAEDVSSRLPEAAPPPEPDAGADADVDPDAGDGGDADGG